MKLGIYSITQGSGHMIVKLLKVKDQGNIWKHLENIQSNSSSKDSGFPFRNYGGRKTVEHLKKAERKMSSQNPLTKENTP